MSYVDPSSYSMDPWRNVEIWNWGKEVWCNMQGKYTTIVADWSLPAAVGTYEMRLCNLGIMGTEYVHSPPIDAEW